MGTMATARINTTQGMVLYRNFIIEEVYAGKDRGNVWEWTHEDFDRVSFPVTGECETLFYAIDAVDDWYANTDEVLQSIPVGEL